jgi:peroxiredoxin
MKHFVIVYFLVASVSSLIAQEITIEAANSSGKVALFSLSGEKSLFIDSVTASNNNTYQFNLSNNHSGFYRFAFNQKAWLDFIYDNEDVEIETDVNNILDSLKILKSESNKFYYEFVKLNKDYKTKTELLQLILTRYPEEDDYYQTTKEKLNQIQEEYLYFVNVTTQINPNSFFARYVRSTQLPVIEAEILSDDQLVYLKIHSLDNVNFYDDGLIYSDAFTNKTIEYLTYYRNPQLPLELLEKEFMAAVDTILSKAKVNEIVYTHLVEYLLEGFKKFGFDNVINYLVENYVIKDDICLDEKLGTALERRIQQAKSFKVGNTVPNIVMQDETGKLIYLQNLNSEKVLIVFYSTTCPHCTKLLPELHRLYKTKSNKEFEVVAISLDEDKSTWQTFIKTNKFDWINVNDTNGWSSKAAADYYIYATPTMFLVDKEKKIIIMPKNIEEIK